MRASRRLATYASGGGNAKCYFNGAPSETLSISKDGVSCGTLTTDSHGLSTNYIELKPGVYSVVGSVSGYTKSVTVKKDGTYNAYPDGAIFWYGNGDTEGDTLFSKCGGWEIAYGAAPGSSQNSNANFAYGTTYDDRRTTTAYQRSSSTPYGATSYIKNRIYYDGHTKLNVTLTSAKVNQGISQVGTCANAPSGAWTAQVASGDLGNLSKTTKSLNLSGDNGIFCASAYNAYYAKPYGSGVYYEHSANNNVYAVWLS